jgi:hypothetical protein
MRDALDKLADAEHALENVQPFEQSAPRTAGETFRRAL